MGTRLYVGNLSYDTDKNRLQDVFSAGGRTVKDVHLLIDRDTGRSRGTAFVELGSEDEAQSAIQELDGMDLDGRNIRVNEAHDKPRGGDRRGGGGGGRGRY